MKICTFADFERSTAVIAISRSGLVPSFNIMAVVAKFSEPETRKNPIQGSTSASNHVQPSNSKSAGKGWVSHRTQPQPYIVRHKNQFQLRSDNFDPPTFRNASQTPSHPQASLTHPLTFPPSQPNQILNPPVLTTPNPTAPPPSPPSAQPPNPPSPSPHTPKTVPHPQSPRSSSHSPSNAAPSS